MHRNLGLLTLTIAGSLVAGSALAQSGGVSSSTAAQSTNTVEAGSASAVSKSEIAAQSRADADARRLRQSIAEKAERTSAKALAKADRRIDAASSEVEHAVTVEGEARVATRLAAEFQTTPEALTVEARELHASLGELMIAHSIAAGSKVDVTTAALVQMHDDGMGWGQIAAGLGLQLGSVVSGIQAETRVASGLAKADGRLQAMRGEGARVTTGAGVGAGIGGGQAGARVGLGTGVRIGR